MGTTKNENKQVPIELKYRYDRNATIQLIRYIHDLDLQKPNSVKEGWLIVPKIYETMLLTVLRHNKYDPVKIKLMEWVLTKNNTIDLIDYSDLDMESFERKQQRSYWEELTDRKY